LSGILQIFPVCAKRSVSSVMEESKVSSDSESDVALSRTARGTSVEAVMDVEYL